MKYFFYSRVSTVGQNASRQTENFKNFGNVTSENLFLDKISGSVPFFERPEAQRLFSHITPTNQTVTVVVDSVDRIGRNLIDILNTIETFKKNKINIKSLKEGFETLTADGEENPIAMMTIAVMGSIAQMERKRIKERQAEGIAIAKVNGKFKGRKIGSNQTQERLLKRHPLIVQFLQKGFTIREIVNLTGKSSATIIKVKKALEQKMVA